MRKLFTLLLINMIALSAFPQRFSFFSDNPTLTTTEMKNFLETAPKERQKDAAVLLDHFSAFWNNPSISSNIQSDFIQIANLMLKNRMRPYPHFDAFINTFISFSNSPLADLSSQWSDILSFHILNEPQQFSQKMKLYQLLFSSNYLNNEQNSRWTFSEIPDTFGIDSLPFIQFSNVILVGSSKNDSLTIFDVSGKFYPSSLLFYGTQGSIDWSRAGMPDVNASFKNFTIDVRFPKILVNNATLNYPSLFSSPIQGTLEDKAIVATDEEKMTYPRFQSNDERIPIKNIYENVDYIGGFEIRGSSIQGFANGEVLAQVSIKKENKQIVNVQSKNFLFKSDGVLSSDAHVKIYVAEDSIYHFSADMKYTEKTHELLISRPKLGVGRAPFFDSYHKLDITAESIYWKTDEERIEFKPLIGNVSETSAIFESQNYFEPSIMRKIQGYNDESPLFTLFKLYKSYDFEPLTLEIIVSYFKRSQIDIKSMIIEFAAKGFVEYDVNNNIIIYRPKIEQYINNEVGRMDYDNIVLESKDHYASLDLTTYDLRITGCEFFVLSNAQIVNVYPTDEKVTVKKNRNMNFSGRIIGGLFDFVAANCVFDYDKFNIEMNIIDSMIMYTEDKKGKMNIYGEYELRRVNSTIEELSGALYIDLPGNKCGRIDHPDFPYFQSRKPGKVFYDQQYVLNGVYTRDKFYYYVDLFKIVNLDNFVIDSLLFAGHLVSGGIFPDIHEPLKIRPDFSLGFNHITQPDGIPMYGGIGHYTNKIDLSNNGLRGKGTINFITSTTVSDSLVFYMDSTNGSAKTHDVAERETETQFPTAHTSNAYMHWMPYQDQMFIHTLEIPVTVFNETELVGTLTVTSQGLKGSGILTFKRADLSSKLFNFKHHELFADTADLRIFSIESNDEFAFRTENYKSHVDFRTRIGSFTANGDASEVLFVKNEFKAKARAFEWNTIDENILKFKWDDDPYKNIDINNTPSRELVDMISTGNELVCTDDGMRGLQFCTTAAEFDFGENIIHAHGVRFVNIGDAAIIPDNGEVTILKDAKIPTLNNSRIVAGRFNKFHEFYNCIANINTGNDFKGSGYIDYFDEMDMKQTIKLDTIWFYQTTQAIGVIPREREFTLSPHFGFEGRIEVSSVDTFITFVGGVEFLHDCDTVKYAKMKIMQQVNPKSIFLDINNRSKDMNDRKVVVAITSANRTGRIYTAFGVAKDQFNDAEYISTFGFITYDHQSQEYRAATREKLLDPSIPGNIIRLNKYDCIAKGTGSIDMGAKLGRIDFHTNGSIINYMKADSATMHLTTSINFFFNDEAMKNFNMHIDNSDNLDFVDPTDDQEYQMALKDLLGVEEYESLLDNSDAFGQVKKIPEKMQVQFLFSNLDFSWDKDNSAFISQTYLPLIICGKKQIYKYIPGRVVIEKRGSRNKLFLYFETNNQVFFFQFENNSMYAFSTDPKFTDAIRKVKAQNRSLKPENGLPSFAYKLGNKSQHKKFMNKYYTPDEDSEE